MRDIRSESLMVDMFFDIISTLIKEYGYEISG